MFGKNKKKKGILGLEGKLMLMPTIKNEDTGKQRLLKKLGL